MDRQISARGTELTDDLQVRVDSLMKELETRVPGLRMAKFVVEERPTGVGVGAILSWGEKSETVVRHAEAADWDRAFLDLSRRLERALEESSAATS